MLYAYGNQTSHRAPSLDRIGKRTRKPGAQGAIRFFSPGKGCKKGRCGLERRQGLLESPLSLHGIRGRGFPLFDLYAIHVDGEFTCGAGIGAGYLGAICSELSIPLIRRESTQKLETLECYRCSRERRKLIFDAAKDVGARVVAFGHHRDDSAQTLLLNLFHKGEFAANLPKVFMRAYGVTIIRPLIYIAEESIRSFAKEYGFARITCQCPVGQNSKRKTVDGLLRQIEEHFPHVRGNLARAGLLYGSDKAATP